jgi:hypothetical protein
MFDNDDDESMGRGRKLRKCRRIFAVLCFSGREKKKS